MGIGYLTIIVPSYELIAMWIILVIAIPCLAVAAGVKFKKKRRSGWVFAVSSAACLLFLVTSYCFWDRFIDLPRSDGTYTEKLIGLTGMDYNEAKAEYSKYFNMTVDKVIYSSEYPAGVIIEQFPREGSWIVMGNSNGNASEVRCTVSKGPQMITVPNTYTVDRETACQMIEGVGLTYSFTNEYSETVPEGCVISTNPERNEMIERGSTVNIVVSKGREETSAEPEESELLINKEE
ncbi:MAG: PASTA domain-containing protein [Oscillospiraceae bacterium]|nr:PASTA domain-containing protein [Oscillospiraceae bacterium]